MNRLSESYKRAVDQNWGGVAKIGFFGQKPRFRAQKKHTLHAGHHIKATTGKSCAKEKVPFSKINISLLAKEPEIFWGDPNWKVVAPGEMVICQVDKNCDSEAKK